MAGPRQSSTGTAGRKPSASSAKARRRAQGAKARPAPRGGRGPASATRPLEPLGRADLWVAAGVAGAATIAFLATFSSRAGLGDAPETVAGVRSLGILHAPGYVTYVVAARMFGEVVRVGSWELRVNLFSLVCAALSVAVVYLLARCFGANKTGSAIGALALATTVSFWFNADFAKYYSFSTLLVTVVALCVMYWQQSRRNGLLVAAGVLIGASIGVSWQLAVIMAVGLVVILAWSRPRPPWAVILVAGAAMLVIAVGVCVFIIVRAGQDPTVNFGRVTSVGRLFELLTTADFSGTRGQAGAGVSNVVGGSAVNFGIIGRDIGIGAVVLALVGIFDVSVRRRLDQASFFFVVAVGNVVAVSFVGGKAVIAGFFSGVTTGGQLADAFVVVAVLAALGATFVLTEVAAWQKETERSIARPERWRAALAVVIVLAVIVPSLLVHYDPANHRIPPLGDRYARRLLAALPQNSILLTGGYEYGQPVLDRQVVYGDRPDVTVVFADFIAHAWYRDELIHRLHLDSSLQQTNAENTVTRFVTSLRKSRPVYADTYAMAYGQRLFAYQTEGLVARIVDGAGPVTISNLKTVASGLQTVEVQDAMTGLKYDRFPNISLYFFYERAHIELAKQYALDDDLDHAADELQRALGFAVKSLAALANPTIAAARSHQPSAKQTILGL